jgi:hypothetical protein
LTSKYGRWKFTSQLSSNPAEGAEYALIVEYVRWRAKRNTTPSWIFVGAGAHRQNSL